MKIGVLGGTFNPPHNAHVTVADDVARKLGLNRILFIPARLPPHKDSTDIVSPDLRLKMVRLAVQGYRNFEVSSIELDRAGTSYTVDTLRTLHAQYGPGTALYLIIGADNLPELPTWKDPEQIVKLATIVVMTRPGFQFVKPVYPWGKGFIYLDVTPLDISSSHIRDMVHRGESVKEMVPGAVRRFIHDNRLYMDTAE
jgi:nicotinate-nucleotide adenylyltransferase